MTYDICDVAMSLKLIAGIFARLSSRLRIGNAPGTSPDGPIQSQRF